MTALRVLDRGNTPVEQSGIVCHFPPHTCPAGSSCSSGAFLVERPALGPGQQKFVLEKILIGSVTIPASLPIGFARTGTTGAKSAMENSVTWWKLAAQAKTIANGMRDTRDEQTMREIADGHWLGEKEP